MNIHLNRFDSVPEQTNIHLNRFDSVPEQMNIHLNRFGSIPEQMNIHLNRVRFHSLLKRTSFPLGPRLAALAEHAPDPGRICRKAKSPVKVVSAWIGIKRNQWNP